MRGGIDKKQAFHCWNRCGGWFPGSCTYVSQPRNLLQFPDLTSLQNVAELPLPNFFLTRPGHASAASRKYSGLLIHVIPVESPNSVSLRVMKKLQSWQLSLPCILGPVLRRPLPESFPQGLEWLLFLQLCLSLGSQLLICYLQTLRYQGQIELSLIDYVLVNPSLQLEEFIYIFIFVVLHTCQASAS